MSFRFTLPALVLIGLVAGCKRSDEVQVYQAPKDRPTAAAGAEAAAGAPASAPERSTAASSAAARPPWVVPDGWTEKTTSGGMRIAAYGVTNADGRSIDVSVVPLAGPAGGMLENVNRWRDQLGLPPIAEADLTALKQTVKIGEFDGVWYDLVSEKLMLDGKYKARTLAAVLPLPGTTVFFKATGEDALVRENADKMKAWLKSVQTGPATPSTAAAPSAGSPPDMRGPVTPPPTTGLPTWEPPANWKSVPASTMRLATFQIPGPNGQNGDLSVVALGPSAGGLLANVNRWRSQFELPPLEEAALSKTATQVALTGGDQATVVELEGQGASAGKRMLAAVVARPDRTWFYKLTGPDALVSSEKEHFVTFLKSVKYP